MTQQNLAGQPLGTIAATLPGATAVLRRHGLDFCCGGDETLAEAANHQGVDATAVAAELAALDPVAPGEAPDETPALIDYIIARYHTAHRAELPELIRLARTVERVHALNPVVPKGLADLLQRVHGELVMHMQKEEIVLFPMMRAGGNRMIGGPIGQMRHEHDNHGTNLRAIERLTRGFATPDDGCATWRALNAGLSRLVDALMTHIHLENNVLFPRFGA